MSLHIVFSNRMEILEKVLLEELARVPADPFEPQHVVVPGTAISRHLQLAIARNMGVCANVKFDYLGSWLWKLAKIVDVKVPDRSPVDPEVMVWLILRILRDDKFLSYERLGHFLKGSDELMCFEFARSLARVFDHYATYRPDWLMIWNQGEKVQDFHVHPDDQVYEEWQSEIWRSVTKALGLGSTHPLKTFLEEITQKGDLRSDSGLPRRATIFGLSIIPPIYLQTITRISEVMDITLYMINPCREYWFDIVSPKRLAYLRSVKRDAYKEIGNLLLADWGRATQSAIDLVYEEATAARTLETSSFVELVGNTLLEKLQRSILNMEDLKNCSVRISEKDPSIEIH
jgi:exodeoxyribonuclease V gamma subunit